jgi:hypothetical protein
MQTLKPQVTHLGPNASFKESPQLLSFIRSQTKYVSSLSPFKQYCVWRYTIGSATINNYLIFNEIKNRENSRIWTNLFFYYYQDSHDHIPKELRGFNYFSNSSFSQLPQEKADKIIDFIVPWFIKYLSKIIKDSPATTQPIQVYKISSSYPGLPEISSTDYKKPFPVPQIPFNSTTTSPDFNFYIFTSPEANCCLWVITIPKGKHVLYIPHEFHAWPFENEVLLPPGVSFNITRQYDTRLSYIDKADINYVQLQEKPFKIGPVYDINTFKPCNSFQCAIREKNFHIFEAILS